MGESSINKFHVIEPEFIHNPVRSFCSRCSSYVENKSLFEPDNTGFMIDRSFLPCNLPITCTSGTFFPSMFSILTAKEVQLQLLALQARFICIENKKVNPEKT